MARTNNCRKMLMEIFGYTRWKVLAENIKEATEPFPITMSWKCIAVGKRKDGRACIFEKAAEQDDSVDKPYIAEGYSWLRFKGCPTIFKYLNPLDMQEEIRVYDAEGHTNMEEGDKFVLEPLGNMTARSNEYQKKRKELIKAGLHIPKVRGPNVNKRKTVVHHFRPY